MSSRSRPIAFETMSRRVFLGSIGAIALPYSCHAETPREISLWDIPEIDRYRAEIEAGRYLPDLAPLIQQAMRRARRVIVPRGVFSISSPIIFEMNEQILEFAEDAWFRPTRWMNGIACPHGAVGCKLVHPGLLGCPTDPDLRTAQDDSCTAILWNSTPDGQQPFGSVSSDQTGGAIEYGRFQGGAGNGEQNDHTWNNFIHANMSGGLVIKGCSGSGLTGTSSGVGYGVVFSGDGISVIDNSFDAERQHQGRHGIYGAFCSNVQVARNKIANFQSSGIAFNTSHSGSNRSINVVDNRLESVASAPDPGATSAGVELAFQSPADRGGSDVIIRGNILDRVGTNGILIRGYARSKLQNNAIRKWGNAAPVKVSRSLPDGKPNYSGIRLEQCGNSIVSENDVSSSYAHENSAHILLRESPNSRILNNRCANLSGSAQRSAVQFDSSGEGNFGSVIRGTKAVLGQGSRWVEPSGIGGG